MTRPTPRIAIDARPRGPFGVLAEARLGGATVLERLVAQAVELGTNAPVICTTPEDRTRLRGLVADAPACEWIAGPAPSDAVTLRADRIYDGTRLRRALRRGRDPESAVIWRLDTPEGLEGAEQELTRRQTYQPLGRFWALAPARALARALRPTAVRPNALTLAAASLMLGAAACVAFAPLTAGVQAATALALALALVLDTADGHLARLQGTASEFGRWLDAYLDELADMALHAAIAWGAYTHSGHVGWLLLGMLYAMGKYQFVVATAGAGDGAASSPRAAATVLRGRSKWRERAIECVRLAGHADIRWHLWIVLAALGRLDVALGAYAVYFPVRALAVAVRQGVRRG